MNMCTVNRDINRLVMSKVENGNGQIFRIGSYNMKSPFQVLFRILVNVMYYTFTTHTE